MLAIFKTNITTKTKVRKIRSALNRLLQHAQWTIDLEDCDKVLRVEGNFSDPKQLLAELRRLGIECAELK